MLELLSGAAIFAAGSWFTVLLLSGRLVPARKSVPRSYVPQRPTVGESPAEQRRSVESMFVNPEFNYDEYMRTGGRGPVPRVKNVDPAGRAGKETGAL